MSRRGCGVAVGRKQLRGASSQREGIFRLELFEHVGLGKGSNGVALGAQSLLPRPHLRLDKGIELAIEISLTQLQHLAQNIRRVRLIAIECEHVEDRVKPKTFGNELANLRGLKVSNGDVLWAPRPLKRRVEIRDLEPAAARETFDEQRIPVIAPARP